MVESSLCLQLAYHVYTTICQNSVLNPKLLKCTRHPLTHREHGQLGMRLKVSVYRLEIRGCSENG